MKVLWTGKGEHYLRYLVYSLPLLFIVARGLGDAVLGIMTLIFLFRSAARRDFSWASAPWFLLALGIWGYLLVQSGFAAQETWQAYRRALGWLRFPLYTAALSYWLLVKREHQLNFLLCAAAASAFVALDVIGQGLSGSSVFGYERLSNGRLSGPFSNHVAGSYLQRFLLPSVVSLWVYAALRTRRYRGISLSAALFFVALIAIAITGERAPLMMTIISLMVFAVLLGRRYWRVIIPGGVTLVIVLGLVLSLSPHMQRRVIGQGAEPLLNDFWQTDYGVIYENSKRMIQRYPLLGVGLRNYRHECMREDIDYRYFQHPRKRRCGLHTHNLYLEWAVETGAIGFALFIGLLGLWLAPTLRGLYRPPQGVCSNDKLLLAASTATLCGFLFPLVPSRSFFDNWNAALFWLVAAIHLITLNRVLGKSVKSDTLAS